MKKTNRKFQFLSLLIAFTLLTGIGIPQTVFAENKTVKNPASVKLSLNQTYTKYDVTGDRKADTIKISNMKKEYDVNTGIKVTINGKKVFYDKTSCYYDLEAYLCTLANGKVFLYLYNPLDNGDADYCSLYQYQKGKLECVINMNKFYGSSKLGYHTNGTIKSVSGNKITVEMYQQNYELGGLSVSYDYKYANGKLTKDGNVTTNFTCWAADSNDGKLTARINMSVYTRTNCKSKAFTLQAGQKIEIKSIYCKSGKMLIKVKRLSDGKTGYIKCIKGNPKNGIAPFSEIMYAG